MVGSTMQKTLVLLVPIVIILVTTYDVLVTVLSHRGAGPVTKFWTSRTWSVLLYVRYRWGWDGPLKIAGPVFLVFIIANWYILYNIAWFILIYNGDYSIEGIDGGAIKALDVLYFLGSTFTTLGLGDITPSKFPWTLVATTGALVVSILTSLSISYLIPVIGAVINRRKMIGALDLLGQTPSEILDMCWTGLDSGQLDGEVLNTSDSLLTESYRTHLYPVLDYFYFGDRHSSMNLAVLNLFDALTIQSLSPGRDGNISEARRIYLVRAIETYLENLLATEYVEVPECSHEDFEELSRENDIDLEAASKDLTERFFSTRSQLLGLAYLEGRCGPDEKGVLRSPNYSEA